jgi:hypothetical protein
MVVTFWVQETYTIEPLTLHTINPSQAMIIKPRHYYIFSVGIPLVHSTFGELKALRVILEFIIQLFCILRPLFAVPCLDYGRNNIEQINLPFYLDA